MRRNVISTEKYEEIKETLNGFTKEEFREIVKDANKNIDILDESIDNLKRVEVQMLDSVQKEVDRLVKSQKECEWGSAEWKDYECYIQSLWTVWGWFFDTLKKYTNLKIKRSDVVRKIAQTLNNEVFFEFNRNTWTWKYKNKTAIFDKNIVDELNKLWYDIINKKEKQRQPIPFEVFVDFSETKYIGKFLSERGDM